MEPIKRPSSRVIVLDEAGRVLMLGIVEPSVGRTVWVPPGGGAESGEDPSETAMRELFEETGLQVERQALGPAVATTGGLWTASDGTVFDSYETYFGLRVDAPTPVATGFTELEQQVVTEFRWWTLDDLEATDDLVFPVNLGLLVRRLLCGEVPKQPIRLPWR